MSVLFLGAFASDFGGACTDVTTTLVRDSNYSPSEVRLLVTFGQQSSVNVNIAENADVWSHFRVRTPDGFSTNSASGALVLFYDAANVLVGGIDLASGQIRAQSGASAFGAGFSMPGLTVYTVDFRVNTVGTDIVVDVYVGGTLVSTATSTKGAQTGVARFNYIHDAITGSFGVPILYSEFLVMTISTIGRRVAVLSPDGLGAGTAWSGDFNDVLVFDDARFIQSDTVGQRESFTLSAFNVPGTPAIYGVVTKSFVTVGATGPQEFRDYLRIGSTDYDGAAKVPTGVGQMTTWLTDPATSAGWLTAALVNLEAGLQSQT